jgi:hypothetical protein
MTSTRRAEYEHSRYVFERDNGDFHHRWRGMDVVFFTNARKSLQGTWNVRGLPTGGWTWHPGRFLDEEFRREQESRGDG